LDAVTKEYRAILTTERKTKGDFLKIEDLERIMTKEYRQKRETNNLSSVIKVKFCYFRVKELVIIAERQATVQMNVHQEKSTIHIQKITENFKLNTELV
jgi:hypothetical protein